MIDIVDPGQGYSAAQYEREAGAIVDRLLQENKLPIVVGGSGLYIRILINGIFPSPPASTSIRKRLKSEAERAGIDALYERLRGLDPAYSDVAAPTDLRRIVRALEVFELTGSPFSAWHERHKAAAKPRDAFSICLIRSRENLYERINARVDEMFERGLVEEVRGLCERGYTDALRQLRPLGYIEALDYLDGDIDLANAIRLTKQNSRHYAKRQTTWFKKEKAAQVELAPTDGAREAAQKILALLPDVFRSRLESS
jgi:tRNA dimethylallyltransferase